MGISECFGDFASGPGAEHMYIQRILGALNDPDEGAVGQRILDTLRRSGCETRISTLSANSQASADSAAAAYSPFDDDEHEQIFIHRIDVQSGGNILRLPITIAHEGGAHAAAWANAPVLHASPYNTENPAKPDLVLCPRDWIRLVILTEQNAFAVEKWIASLAAQHDPRFNSFEAIPLQTPEMFQDIRNRTGNLKDALVEMANQCMDAHFNGAPYRFGHFYVGNALTTYNICNRLKDRPEGLIPVRMELEDLLAAGDTIGPNIFGDERLYGRGGLERFIFEDGEHQIQALNHQLGIKDENALPTFREACATFGLTPSQFLQQSKLPRTALQNHAPNNPQRQVVFEPRTQGYQ